jgi:hypothetical protein
MKSLISTFFTITIGLIVLVGTLLPLSIFGSIRLVFLDWAIIISSFAMLLAILNLIIIHWKKLFSESGNDFYSLFFIIGFSFVFIIGLIFSPENLLFQNLSRTIILSVESSLMALLSISLAVACFKLLRVKRNGLGIVFAISTILFLITLSGLLSIGENIPFIKSILSIINQLPLAGARGILLGISFGGIITGLRVLLGFDRPYKA